MKKKQLLNKGVFKSLSEFQLLADPKKGSSLIGMGSFGEVSLVKCKKDKRIYAIKQVISSEIFKFSYFKIDLATLKN
jgi:hypothetical protein